MILTTTVRTGVAAARGAVRLVTAAGTHAAWWLEYRIGGGTPHRAPEDPRRRPPAGR
ncbi:MAG: hypothetical protein QOF37_1855 [Thermoleophilaceae bacterium]|jgi:hypothetical protein|nr:hypothetical protein [Thermoleophilaceae bacterium]